MSKRNESIGVLTPKTYKHDLSHQHTTTLDWFRLQPLACIEMLEKDKFSVNIASLLEAAPLATKVYGSAFLDFHAFFVPKRILWTDWNNYRFGNNREGTSSYTIPHLKMIDLSNATGGARLAPSSSSFQFIPPVNNRKDRRRVFGGLGYPTSAILNVAGDGSLGIDTEYSNMPISAMEARSYQRVWWDWYRDSVHIPESNKASYLYTSGGKITNTEIGVTFQPRYRCFRKDYITTLLDSPQLGESAVAHSSTTPLVTDEYASNTTLYPGGVYYKDGANFGIDSSNSSVGHTLYKVNLDGQLQVNALRGAIAMQRFLEKLNVTGTRPIERIQSLFGSAPNPVRLDMSEFIGSFRQRISVSGLTNTGSNTPLSDEETNTNAFGIGSNASNFGQQQGRSYNESQSPSFSYSATEDGYFLVIASLMPEYANPSATNRQFFRGLATPDSSPLDFYTHEFDGLGYQECLYNEIALPEYTLSTEGLWGIDYDPYRVAGYQPKYEDYRYLQDRISGDFNEPENSTALRNMVYVRNFQDGNQSGQLPSGISLTTPTVEDVKSFDNHFLVTDSSIDHFILNTYLNIDAVRPVSKVELPTELADLANSNFTDVSNGGMRL